MEINFEEITIKQKLSTRGGGIEIDLSTLGFEGEKMVAFQNYLGGGMLGRVVTQNTLQHVKKVPFMDESDAKKLDEISMELRKYFFDLTNPDTEWESQDFEQNQKMPVSAY